MATTKKTTPTTKKAISKNTEVKTTTKSTARKKATAEVLPVVEKTVRTGKLPKIKV